MNSQTDKLDSREWIKDLRPKNETDSPKIYVLKSSGKVIFKEEKIQIFRYGAFNISKEINILLLGETGSGKTALINSMINYIAGIKFDDDYRLEIDRVHDFEEKNESNMIVVYKIFNRPNSVLPYTLNLIDSPGISCNEDFSRDNDVVNRIKDFLRIQTATIHAACLVINSTIARLTPEQKQVLQQISDILNDSLLPQVVLFCNRALNTSPVVIKTLKRNKFPHCGYFVFENGSIFNNRSTKKHENNLPREQEKQRNSNKTTRTFDIEMAAKYYQDNEANFTRFFVLLEKSCQEMAISLAEKFNSNSEMTHEISGSSIDEQKTEKNMIVSKQMSSSQLIEYLNFELSYSNETWKRYNLPLIETSDTENDSSKEIKVFETMKVNCTESQVILVFGYCHKKRMQLIELIINNYFNIQPQESIMLTIAPKLKPDSDSDCIFVYKLYPFNGNQNGASINLFNIPLSRSKDDGSLEKLDKHFEYLVTNKYFESIHGAFYIVDNTSVKNDNDSCIFQEFNSLITVCSFEFDTTNLKKKFDKFKYHTGFPKIKNECWSQEALITGLKNLNNCLKIPNEVLENSRKLISKIRKRYELKRKNISQEEQLKKIDISLENLEKEIKQFHETKTQNQDFQEKRKIVKWIKPKNTVINCENCEKTCCIENHKKSFLEGLRSANSSNICKHLVSSNSDHCNKCNCPPDYHSISGNVQYTEEYDEILDMNPEKKFKFEKADKKLKKLEDDKKKLETEKMEAKKVKSSLYHEYEHLKNNNSKL